MSWQGLVWLWLVLNTGAFLLEIFYMFPSLYMLHSGGDSGRSVRMNIYIFFPFCCYPTSQCATVKLCQAEISSKKC